MIEHQHILKMIKAEKKELMELKELRGRLGNSFNAEMLDTEIEFLEEDIKAKVAYLRE